jgi:hypothetical protein
MFGAPELRELHLEGDWYYSEKCSHSPMSYSALTKLESLILIGTDVLSRTFSTPKSLRKLHLENNQFRFVHDPELKMSFADLEVLNLWGYVGLSTHAPRFHTFFQSGSEKRVSLKKFSTIIWNLEDFHDVFDFLCHDHASTLRELEITFQDFDDAWASAFMGMSKLELLHVKNSTKLTGVGIRRWVDQGLPSLRRLEFTNCTGISPDAFDYARAHGIEVKVVNREHVGGGRRVRGLYH